MHNVHVLMYNTLAFGAFFSESLDSSFKVEIKHYVNVTTI